MALGNISLKDFSIKLSQSQNPVNQEINPEAEKWVADNLTFETKRLLRQSQEANGELQKLKQEAVEAKVKALKKDRTTDSYGDTFNRIVCKTADSMDVSLPEAEGIVREGLRNEISETDVEEYLSVKLRSQKEKRLQNLLSRNYSRLGNSEKAIALTSIFFEIDQIETDKVWGADKFENILIAGLNGKKINLITILCLVNQFDYNGGYVSNPNPFAYLENPKLEAVPLIVDETVLLTKLFNFYGINTPLTIYVADTDYTEIGEYGPVNNVNIENIRLYIENLDKYLEGETAVRVSAISSLTDNSPVYQQVKARVLENVRSFKDPDFEREFYQRFENDVEKRFESQVKRKLFPQKDIRRETLRLTRNIWACNAAQGAVLSTLDSNTVLVSTERRERDENLTINRDSRKTFPPVLYVLKAAEAWNRKIVQKGI